MFYCCFILLFTSWTKQKHIGEGLAPPAPAPADDATVDQTCVCGIGPTDALLVPLSGAAADDAYAFALSTFKSNSKSTLSVKTGPVRFVFLAQSLFVCFTSANAATQQTHIGAKGD